MKEQQLTIETQETQLVEQKPKVDFYDSLTKEGDVKDLVIAYLISVKKGLGGT